MRKTRQKYIKISKEKEMLSDVKEQREDALWSQIIQIAKQCTQGQVENAILLLKNKEVIHYESHTLPTNQDPQWHTILKLTRTTAA